MAGDLPPSAFLIFFALDLIGNFASACGCIWLLRRLLRLPKHAGRRLFPQQVRWLAASDLVYHLVSLVAYTLSLAQAGATSSYLCVCWDLRNFGANASILIQLHIAVSFVCKSAGWSRTMGVLVPMLYGIWPLAAFLTLVEDVVADSWCRFIYQSKIFFALLIFSFGACLVSYGVSVRMAQRSNASVARSSWHRARMYPLNFLLTKVMLLLQLILRMTGHVSVILYCLGLFLMNLSGLVNTLTYALQSRYAVQLLRQNDSRGVPGSNVPVTNGSFHVRFGVVEVLSEGVAIEELLAADLSTIMETLSDPQIC